MSGGDAPDWTGIPGSARYLGTLTVPPGTNQTVALSFTPQPTDSAIIAFPDNAVWGEGIGSMLLLHQLDLLALIASISYGPGKALPVSPFVGPVSLAMGRNWELRANTTGTNNNPVDWFVWALPSVIAALASDNNVPLLVQLATPPTGGFVGQQVKAASLPVVSASDWIPSRTPDGVRIALLTNQAAATVSFGTTIAASPATNGWAFMLLQWVHMVRGTALGTATNALTIFVTDTTVNTTLVYSIASEGVPDHGFLALPFPLRPQGLDNTVAWQIKGIVSNLVGTANSDIGVTAHLVKASP